MKPKYLFLVTLLLSCSITFANDNYKIIGTTSYETLSFNTDTIRFIKEFDELNIEVWIKHQPTIQGAKEYIQERQRDKLIIKGFENFSYYVDHKLYAMDKKSCWIDSIDYAKDGSILDSKYYPMRNWQHIIVGSEDETIWFAIMQYAQNNQWLLTRGG
jgi:hypothetical protein